MSLLWSRWLESDHTGHATSGAIRRRRECKSCGVRFNTFERAEMSTPLLIKHDGDREEFDS